ncbi:MAG: cupin domain-containing protein [Deltaproteobacteria bacterium]|nr:cupin domain-containing protein [Deltaproteobacteria bacterium]
MAQLLAPLSWSTLRDHWGLTHVHAPGDRARLGGLATWRDLEVALETQRVAPSRLLVGYHRGVSVVDAVVDPRGHATTALNAPELRRHLRERRALVVFEADAMLPRVAALADGLARDLGLAIESQLFVSAGDGESFGTHRDDCDHIIVQLEGRKRWRLFGARAGDAAPTEACAEIVLAPGDVLYVPRDHWHEVRDLGEPSLHLTCVIATPTGRDLVSWLAAELRDTPELRAPLPRFANADARGAHARQLRDRLRDAWTDDLLDRYLASSAAMIRPRPRVAIADEARADGLPDGDAFVIASNVPAVRDVRIEGDEAVFAAAQREWRLDAALAPVLRRLLVLGPWSMRDLVAAGDAAPEDLRALVAELVAAGLLFVMRELR